MTTGNAAAGPASGYQQPAARYLRCGRCGVPQPALTAGSFRCVSCGAPLQRWVAHPPPGTGASSSGRSTAKRPGPALPYLGPPSYRGGHPRWSFPPVVWKELPDPPAEPVRPAAPGLRRASWLAVVTAVAAAAAAGSEIWRFVLMLQGRTQVLSGTAVRTSDVLVAATGLAVVVAAIATAAVAVPALVRAHRAAALRQGRAPSRSAAAVASRLLVPFWNIYGAGQIVTEIDRMLEQAVRKDEISDDEQPRQRADRRPVVSGNTAPAGALAGAALDGAALKGAAVKDAAVKDAAAGDAAPEQVAAPGPAEVSGVKASRLTTLWWFAWVASSVLVVVTLARGWGEGLQAIADTVQLHIAVDLVAVVVGVLTALMLRRFARLFDGRRDPAAGWVVQPPAPTRPLPAKT